jgi:hypothetical protein
MTTIISGYVDSPQTLEGVQEFIKAQGLEEDEYFNLSSRYGRSEPLTGSDLLYTPGTRWIAVFCVEGGSEGYYVHVERISNDKEMDCIFLGKFWQRERAMEAVTLLTACVNGWRFER